MRKSLALACAILCAASPVLGVPLTATATNVADQPAATIPLRTTEPKITARGESHRIWERVTYLTNYIRHIPRVAIVTNTVTELGAGICYQQQDGAWADSKAELAIAPDGGAEALQIPHKVHFSPDIRTVGAIKMTLPDGRLMSSTFRGLYLYDSSTQKRLIVSEITNSIGAIVPPNLVVYSNCFAGLSGDLVLKVTPAGLAQDVVLRESLDWIPFADIGFDPKFTVLEAWTEFYETPAPEKQTNTISARVTTEGQTADLTDETLKFGDVLMQPGRAYFNGDSPSVRFDASSRGGSSIPVGKAWQESADGRRFLIERVRWREVLPQFKRLDSASAVLTNAAVSPKIRRSLLPVSEPPPKLMAQTFTRPILMAQVAASQAPAFVLDYTTVLCSGGICNGYRFEANQTYWINGPVTINGEAVLFGGTVLKFADLSSSATITINGTLRCETGPGRMALITAEDDNAIGEIISGSTGDPASDFYGWPGFIFSGTASPVDLKYVRMTYIAGPVEFRNPGPNEIRHSQFVNGYTGVVLEHNSLVLRNVLFHNVDTLFSGSDFSVHGEHVTAHQGSTLAYEGQGTTSTMTFVNSLIVAIPAYGAACSLPAPSVRFTTEPPQAVFQTSVLGAHYLAPDSVYRGIGNSAIDPELRQALKGKTTYPPVLLPATSTTTMILSPAVPRNDSLNPDIGFSYDVLDYVARNFRIESGTVVATNGVAIGVDAGAGSWGIQVAAGATFVGEGTPLNMNRLVELRSIQEQPGASVSFFATILKDNAWTAASHLRFRFTEFLGRAGIDSHIYQGNSLGTIALTDCQLLAAGLRVPPSASQEYTVALTNNLFQWSKLVLNSSGATHCDLWNNSFYNGEVSLVGGNFSWQARDNLFDSVNLSASPAIGNSYNGYYNTTALAGSGGNVLLAGPINYQTGPLGKSYLPAGSCLLLCGGSRSPADAHLFHHTTQVSQQKEGSKELGANCDIGFHYVAVSAPNLARYKYATQSSTDSGRNADRAIDGTTNGVMSANSVSSTLSENKPWWQLDLGFPEHINLIKIWNRTDCCGDRLSNFYVFVSDDPFASTDQTATLAQPGVSSYLVSGQAGSPTSVLIARSGRYIRIQLTSQNYLSLAEVEVNPTPSPIDTEQDSLGDYFEDRNGNGIVDSGETNFKGPIVSFTTPANGFSIGTTRMNMRGTVSQLGSALKRVTVNGIRSFLTGNTFDVLNMPFAPGANTITAVAEDINGNFGSATIAVLATGTLVDPVTLTATPVGGFESLNVTLTSQANVPGTIQEVRYDFIGNNTTSIGSLGSVNHSYTAGEYFPVVTVSSTVSGTLLNFSSLGGFTATPGNRLKVVVQKPLLSPTITSVQSPVDLKVTADGSLYVLSQSSPSKLTQFDQGGAVVRLLSSVGTAPSGFDVDANGKVYIAATGDNQILRFLPTATSFRLDLDFGAWGHVGRDDKASGSGATEFNSPYDVAVSADNNFIYVSDANNHRIRKFSEKGIFVSGFGSLGSGVGQFNGPKGLSLALDGSLVIADSGNNRLVLAFSDRVIGLAGSAGSALGQYQGPLNVSSDLESIYVADTGNNRVQKIERDLFNPLWSLSANFTTPLNQPKGISVGDTSVEERVYIADTGNDRVVIVTVPKVVPDNVWTDTRQKLINGQIEDALKNFSVTTIDSYRQEFANLGNTLVNQYMSDIGALTPAYVDSDESLYYFTSVIDSVQFTFFVTFVKEDGQWKVRNF